MPKKVLCIGVWDLFHFGHLKLIERASALGDLTAAVVEDAAVKAKKGPSRPVIKQEERLAIVRSLRNVKHVEIVPDFEFPKHMIDTHDIVVIGEDQSHIKNVHLIPPEKLHRLTRTDGVSTSAIVKRLDAKPSLMIASNNIQNHLDLPSDTIIRINLAWVPTVTEAEAILNSNKNRTVFLDFPQGRSKPPTPSLTLEQSYALCTSYQQVKFFAVSNIEDVTNVQEIQQHIPSGVEFVPKIETINGVNNLANLVYDCNIRYLMLDKEDLYLDVGKDNKTFFKCVDSVRAICRGLEVYLFELEGVIFLSSGAKRPSCLVDKERKNGLKSRS